MKPSRTLLQSAGRWLTRRALPTALSVASSSSALCCRRRWQSSTSDRNEALQVEYPIVQLPARSLLSRQSDIDLKMLRQGEYDHLMDKLVATRKHYQYPSLCAPQMGWNVRVLTLFDGTVWVNPSVVEVNCPVHAVVDGTEVEPGVLSASLDESSSTGCSERRQPAADCWAWEPCASCAFLMHYIQRPGTCRVKGWDRKGVAMERVLHGMSARFLLHEMDHLDGVLFTRRIPDTNHVVLLDGFSTMSDWSDDYPSLESRSTFLYTTFTPPHTFITDSVPDANLLDRKFEDNIYPGHEMDRQMRVEHLAFEEIQRSQWREMKESMASGAPAESVDVDGEVEVDEPATAPTAV